MIKRTITAALVLLLSIQLTGLNVAEKELKKGGKQVKFNRYRGRYTRILSRDEIRLIGFELNRISRRNNIEYDLIRKYSILHAVGPAEKDKYDADIFSINPRAKIVDINGIRIILGAYLERRYKYSEQDALTVAKFITFYNAAHRGELAYYRANYKQAVTRHMTRYNAGISTDYRQWPGRTKVIIPLSDTVTRDITAVDTTKLTDDKVIKKLQKKPDKGVQDRDKILKIQKDQTAKKQQNLDKDKQDTAKKQQDLDKDKQQLKKQQQDIKKKQQYLDNKKQQADKIKDPAKKQQVKKQLADDQKKLDKDKQDATKKQQDLKKQQQDLDKKKQDQQKQQQKLDKDKQKLAKDKQQLDKDKQQVGVSGKPNQDKQQPPQKNDKQSPADKKDDGSKQNTKTDKDKQDLKKQQQDLTKQKQDLDKRKQKLDQREDRLKQKQSDKRIYAGAFFYLKVREFVAGGHYNNEMVLIDPATRRIVKRSDFKGICGKKYDVYSKGAVVIGHPGNHSQEHFLLLLSPKDLSVKARGKANVYWRSFIEVRDGFIYAVIVDNKAYRLGKFDENMKLVASSAEFVERDTFISFFGDYIYLNSREKKILVLNRKDLKKTAIIKP